MRTQTRLQKGNETVMPVAASGSATADDKVGTEIWGDKNIYKGVLFNLVTCFKSKISRSAYKSLKISTLTACSYQREAKNYTVFPALYIPCTAE